MATQYTTILKLALPTQGELSGTWGDVVNDNITEMVEEAIAGRKVINTWTTNSHTLTTADGTTSESRAAILTLTDTGTALTGAGTVICPANSKVYIVENGTGQTITVKTSSGTGVAVPDGKNMVVFCDGTNVEESITNINSLTLNGDGATVSSIKDEDNMASDSATALATQQSIKAYVDSQVGSFDTLAEVLANGNTTGGTDLSVSSGDDITFADSSKAIFGAGSDLQIYHDGSNSYINDTSGTGNLYLASNQLIINNAANTENMARFAENGAATLYYDGSAKLATTSTGIDVTGITSTDTLGVGVSSASNTVHIKSSNPTIRLEDGDGSGAGIAQVQNTASGNLRLIADPNNDGASSSTIEFEIDGSEYMRLTSAGRLGLGTTSPNQLLTLGSGTGSDTIGLDFETSNVSRGSILYNAGAGEMAFTSGYSGYGGYMTFDCNGSERMRINSSGNVGIGTTSPSNSLHVSGTASTPALFERTGSTGSYIGLKDSSGSLVYLGDNNGTFEVQTAGSAYSTKLAVTSAGNVGIGTTSPDYDLEIEGATNEFRITDTGTNNTYARVATATNSATLQVGRQGLNSSVASLIAKGNGSYLALDNVVSRVGVIESESNGDLSFSIDDGTTDTEFMRLDYSSGNVGIGTTAPGVELDVHGTTDTTIRVYSSGTGASDDTILRSQIAGTTASNYLFFGDTDDNNAGQIRYVHSDDSMRFYAGATTERLRLYSTASIFYNGVTEIGRFHSNNHFGIGTSNPPYDLTVSNSGAEGLEFGAGYTSGANIMQHYNRSAASWVRADSYADYYRFYVSGSGTAQMTLDTAGKLGIGTTSPSNNLDVTSSGNTGIRIGSAFSGSTTTGLFIDTVGDTSAARLNFSKSGTTRGIIGYSHNASANSEAITFGTGGGSERMRVNATGVGIGNSAPATVLDIIDTSQTLGFAQATDVNASPANLDVGEFVRYASDVADANLTFAAGDARLLTGAVNTDNTVVWRANNVGLFATDSVRFYSGGSTEAARIDSSGNLLVGKTSSSDSAFEFETSQGNSSGGQIGRVSMGRSSSGYPVVGYNCAPRSVSNSYTKFIADYAAWIQFGVSGRIDTYTTTTTATGSTSGTAGPYLSSGGTSWTSSSDRRLKDNIEGISYGLEAVKSLNPVSYVRNDRDTGATELGFIAQEVDEVVSEVVSVKDDGYYGIDYERLIPVLTKAIQDQQEIIDNLKSRIEQLEGAN
jgi:hypothetical protein